MRLKLPFEYSGAPEAESAWVTSLIAEGVESVRVLEGPAQGEQSYKLVKSATGLIDPRQVNIFVDPRREGLR